jgi:hypothetical protein
MIISILDLVSNYCCNKDPEFGFPIIFIGLLLIKYVNCYPLECDQPQGSGLPLGHGSLRVILVNYGRVIYILYMCPLFRGEESI